MISLLRQFAIVLIAALPAAGQAFEVASVRMTPPGSVRQTYLSPPGAASFTATNVTLDVLIEVAFGVDENQISGRPYWLGTEHYDVTGKPEGAGGLSYVQLRPMLQQLLTTRFKLAVHRETRDVSGYALVVGNGGPKLTESTTESGHKYILPDGIRFDHTSLATFAAALARPTGHPVVDKTGIAGNYNINIEYAQDGATDSSRPSLFTALQEQLGLKLEPQKVPFESLIIDHVDKVPTGN
jgi:uncharacterized protein (TIGR03435 family)